jgi:hypothetical protein
MCRVFVACVFGLLASTTSLWAGYSGRLQFNHARPGGGATSGYNTEATKTVIGNLIWYRNVYQSNPSNTGTQPQAYEWDNWYWKFGPRRGGGSETDFLNPNNNVQIMSTIDSGNGSDNTPDPQHMWVDVQNSKSYVFNLTDNNNGSLEPSRGYDVATFSVIEVNHQSTLASFKNAGDESRSGNTVTLHLSNNTEQASSTEELWVQWTYNGFSTKNFVEITDLSSADRTLPIALSASAPILREGDTLQWLAVLTSDTDTSTVSATHGSVLGFDASAIYRNNGSGVNSYTVADDDTTAPSLSGFSIAGKTDAEILAGGWTISGSIQDTGSGVNDNGATVTGTDFSPNYDVQNGANTVVANNQVFTTKPSDGAAMGSPGTLSATAPAVAAASIDLGTYKITVSAEDNDEDPTTASNDGATVIDSQVATFAVTDDDTTAPALSGFTVDGDDQVTDAQVVSGGYTVSGSVQDTGSGVNDNGATVTGDNFSPNYDILNNANNQIVVNQLITTRPADGAAQGSPGTLSVSAAARGTGSGASTTVDLGTYKVQISITDNDEDRSSVNDRQAAVDSQVKTFTVVDDDTTGPSLTGVTGNSVSLNGAVYTNVNLGSGLAVSASVQDDESGVAAGTSSTYGLARDGSPVTTGSLSPSFANGGAQGSPGTLTVTLGAGFVQTVGSYVLTITNQNYDLDRGATDQETTVNSFSFTVEAANLPPGIGYGPASLSFATMVGVTPAAQTFGITNVGGQTLTYTNSISYGSGSGWLSVAPVSVGLASLDARQNTATVSVAAMAAGAYSATINIADAGASNSPQSISVSLSVTSIPAPTASVVADGPQMNRLDFSAAAGRHVLVVYRQGAALSGDPVQGTPYSLGASLGGGTVLHKGIGTYLEHVVAAGQSHYYRFYTTTNDHYSASVSANTTTPTFQGNVIVDQMSYTDLVVGAVGNFNGGSGWSGAWAFTNKGSGTWMARTNSSTAPFEQMPNYQTNYGNRLRMTDQGPANGEAWRSFPAITNGKIYAAYLLSYQFAGSSKYAGLSFYSNSVEKAYFGEVGFANKQLGLDSYGASQGSSYDLNDYNTDDGNVYLVVGAYDFSTRELKTKAFYRTTTVPLGEPSSWDATATVAAGRINMINGIRLLAGCSDGFNSVGLVHFDEVRLARTWADLVNTIAPVVTNYTVNGAAAANDGQVKSGGYSVTMNFYDPAGLLNSGSLPNYDVFNPSAVQITTDRTFAVTAFADSGRSLIGSNNSQNASSSSVVELGTYTLRWSEYNSNNVSTINSTTLSNGVTPLSFTVTDDDTAAPTFGTALENSAAMEFRIGTGADGTNYYASGSGTNVIVRVTDADLLAVDASNPMRFVFSLSDPSGINRSGGGPLADVMNFDVGVVGSAQNIFGSYSASRSTTDASANTATSVFYHSVAFSVSEVNSFISAVTNRITVSAPDMDDDRSDDDRTFLIDKQAGLFVVTDDDTTAPVASGFTAVNGTAYNEGDLAGGLLVTGLIQDAGSGVYGGTSNRYQLLRNGSQVDSGAFTTRPAANGNAMGAAEALAVTLSGANVDVVGSYTFIVLSRDYDVDRTGDSLVGSNSFAFTVSSVGCPGGTAPTLTQPGNKYITEGNLLSFTITISDSVGCAAPSLTASDLPSGASFNSSTSGSSRTGTFTWTPGVNQSGTYPVRFSGTDSEPLPLSTSLIIRVYVADAGEPTNSAGVPVSQTNWHVTITNIQVPSSGNITVVYSSVNGVAYDVYRSDNNYGGAMTWAKVVTEDVAAGSTDSAVLDSSVSQRYFQVVLAGGAPSSNGVWAVIRPTINAASVTLVSPGTAGDRKFNGELGTNLAKVL